MRVESDGAVEPAIKVQRVDKRYGRQLALRSIDMTVQPGEMVGFIGPNGAGKSTLMRILAGLARADAGTVRVLGQEVDGSRSPHGIGVVVEQQGHLPYLSGRRNLTLLASVSGRVGRDRITEVLGQVGLDPTDRRPVMRWSFGMRQRLTIAQALMERPRLLLLDEPTNGLDPVAVAELRELLGELTADGVAVLLASHALTEVERLCARVYFVRGGEVIDVLARDDTDVISVQVCTEGDLERLRVWAAGRDVAVTPSPGPFRIQLPSDLAVPEVVRELVGAGVELEAIGRQRRSLEEQFLQLVGHGAT